MRYMVYRHCYDLCHGTTGYDIYFIYFTFSGILYNYLLWYKTIIKIIRKIFYDIFIQF